MSRHGHKLDSFFLTAKPKNSNQSSFKVWVFFRKTRSRSRFLCTRLILHSPMADSVHMQIALDQFILIISQQTTSFGVANIIIWFDLNRHIFILRQRRRDIQIGIKFDIKRLEQTSFAKHSGKVSALHGHSPVCLRPLSIRKKGDSRQHQLVPKQRFITCGKWNPCII